MNIFGPSRQRPAIGASKRQSETGFRDVEDAMPGGHKSGALFLRLVRMRARKQPSGLASRARAVFCCRSGCNERVTAAVKAGISVILGAAEIRANYSLS